MNFQMERQHLQNSMGRFAFVFRNLLWPEFKLPLRHGPVFQRVSKTVFSEKIINLNHFMIHRYYVKIVKYCARNANLIPLSFVLGFFVNIVYSRWWSQFTAIPVPDNLALLIGANIKGQVMNEQKTCIN